MSYQRKKRAQEQHSSQTPPQVQASLFASPEHETTTEEMKPDRSDSSSLSLDNQRQLATQSSFDFGQIPLYAPDQAAPSPVQRMPLIQAKLTVGPANDKYEQEADRVATEVVDTINSSQSPTHPQGAETLQTKEDSNTAGHDTLQQVALSELQRQGDDEELQTKPLSPPTGLDRGAIDSGAISPTVERDIQAAKGSGQALDSNLQQQMGQAMGADFSGVKIHTDTQADQLNKTIQAKAFTTGQDVFFRQDAYNPHSKGGQKLIAHELTHVVQQTGNTVQRSPYTSTSAPMIQRETEIQQGEFDTQVRLLAMLYAVASEEQPRFAEKADQLKTATGASKLAIRGQDKIAIADKIKSMERAAFKGAIKYKGDIRQITDVVGASLVYDDLASIESACNAMPNALHAQDLTLVRFKNRFKKPSPEEYADLMLNLQMPSGHIVELQMHLKDMKQQKDKAGAVNTMEAKKRLREWQGTRNLSDTVLRDWVNLVGSKHEDLISGHGIYKMKRADQEYAELILEPALQVLKKGVQDALAAITVQDRTEQAEASHVGRIGGQEQEANEAISDYESKKAEYLLQKQHVDALLTNANDLAELARVILYGPEFQKLKQNQQQWNAITQIDLPTEDHVQENQTVSATYVGMFKAARKDTYKRYTREAERELKKHYQIVEDSPAQDDI